MKAIILAGGSGTRLWPLSRKSFPKQFLKLNTNRSLLQQAIERLLGVLSPHDIMIVTNRAYEFYVKSDLEELFGPIDHGTKILFEPKGRNTAPAIALGVRYWQERGGATDDETVFVCPSDHVIRPAEKFSAYLEDVKKVAQKGYLVTFGIKPDRPETGFGYIKKGDRLLDAGSNIESYRVEKFTEKPDSETAGRYVSTGDYFWNSGMFSFTVGTITREIARHAPGISRIYSLEYEEMEARFNEMPEISIDYAVMEKADRIATLPLDLYWNDVGSWDSVFEIMDRDDQGNTTIGNVVTMDTKDTMIMGGNRLMAAIGLKDCLVVETDDAVLIARRGYTQKVKEMVGLLKEKGCKEVLDHVTVNRPWGSYTVLEEDQRYQIKRVVVTPGEKLSLQMHHHRSEHWVVVKGTAKVTIADKVTFVHENESAYVPKSTIHRLENPGKIPLELIEVQNGEYVKEDDITRFEDKYNRKM